MVRMVKGPVADDLVQCAPQSPPAGAVADRFGDLSGSPAAVPPCCKWSTPSPPRRAAAQGVGSEPNEPDSDGREEVLHAPALKGGASSRHTRGVASVLRASIRAGYASPCDPSLLALLHPPAKPTESSASDRGAPQVQVPPEGEATRRRPEPLADRGSAGRVLMQAGLQPGAILEMMMKDKESSLAVQGALEMGAEALRAAPSEAARVTALAALQSLLRDLRGHVLAAIRHETANFVVARALELAPPSLVQFVAEEILGHGIRLAKGRISCRSVLRVFRHQPDTGAASALASEILSDAEAMCRHQYGSYVAQELLVVGSSEQKRHIFTALCSSGLLSSAKDGQHSSRTMEAAIEHCSPEELGTMANELLGSDSVVCDLLSTRYGRHVAKAFCKRLPLTDPRVQHLESVCQRRNSNHVNKERGTLTSASRASDISAAKALQPPRARG